MVANVARPGLEFGDVGVVARLPGFDIRDVGIDAVYDDGEFLDGLGQPSDGLRQAP